MRALSNDYTACRLVNLEPGTEGGPFVVVQTGYGPEDPSMRERMFLLQRDGVWIDEFAHSALPEAQQFAILFETAQEVMAALAELTGKPAVVRAEVTTEDIQRHLSNLQTQGGEARVRAFLEAYRSGRRGK